MDFNSIYFPWVFKLFQKQGSFLVPTHWQWHLPVLRWTPKCAQVETCLYCSLFPFKTDLSTLSPSHLSNADSAHTSYSHKSLSTPSAMANPMALVPASFLPCLPHPLKIPSSYPYPTPCSVSHCLGSLPLSWGEGADPAARVSVSAAAAGVEQAGLPPPREPSYNLPHHLPQALFFRCSGQIPEEECLSCGQIRILAAVLGASSCLSGSNVSMDCSSLWQISWKNTAEKWFPKSDFIAFCLPRRQAPQLSQCIRLHTAVRVTWAVTPDKMPAGRHISLSSGHHVEAENPADTAKHRGVWFPGSHTEDTAGQ